MSESTVVFGLHSVRALLTQRPERASLLVLQKGRDDARSAELLRLAQAAGVRTEWRDACFSNNSAYRLQQKTPLAQGGRR